MNLRLDLAYDGAPFRGFARQPEVRTIQGELEIALGRIFKGATYCVAAGRTDAGVHALGQVVNVPEAPDGTDPGTLVASLNRLCGPSISVTSCREVSAEFSARFSARSRTYVYAILESDVPDPFLQGTCLLHKGGLNVGAMNEAAGHLLGPHDFSSFGRLPDAEATPTRNLFELEVRRTGQLIRIKARANAFIHQMVRSLVGTLLQVGEEKTSPTEMGSILAAKDRAAAGPVAPAHGLCLVSVEYDDGWSTPPVS
ncbi:MAG: tRNA pseudouridine(38-40) synthase TruA [Actinomycetota bacterium]